MLRIETALIVFGLIVGTSSRPIIAADFQNWDEIDFSDQVAPRVTVTFPVLARESFKLRDPQLDATGALIDVRVNNNFTLTGGYLYVNLPFTGRGYEANVPLVAATVKEKIGSFVVSDRSRAEQLFGLPDFPVRYRNKVNISVPLDNGRWAPFIANEAFFDFSQSRWTQDRFQVGVDVGLNDQVRLNTYYLVRTNLRNGVNDVNAIGLTLEVRLR
jgi:hypothetical protein